MYRPKKQAEAPSAPRRPKLEAPPTLAEIKTFQADADANRGREMEVLWPGPTGKTYLMNLKQGSGPVEPMWILYEDDGSELKMVWQYQTIDAYLIHDCIQMLDPTAAPTAVPSEIIAPPKKEMGAPFGTQSMNSPAYGAPAPAMPAAIGAPANGAAPVIAPALNKFGGIGEVAAPPMAPPQQAPAKDIWDKSPYSKHAEQAAPPAQTGYPGAYARDDSFPTAHSPAPTPHAAPPPPPPQQQRPPSNEMQGSLEDIKIPMLINNYVGARATGKLEVRGEESVGSVFFVEGAPVHATTPSAYGDGAIRELVTWEKGTYEFMRGMQTDMRSVQGRLDAVMSEGQALLDQKRHLKRAGLTFESYLLRKHKHLSDSELKLMLMKGAQIDFDFQKRIYDYLKTKRTFTDFLRDHPMDSTTWTALLFNFISCGLIEIKEPDTVKDSVLDFLGPDKEHMRTLTDSFVRKESGIYSYDALLFFMEYEFHRFEAYNHPLSMIIFEILRKRQDGSGGMDLITGQAANTAAQRINLIKRPLDTLGHFQTLDFALLLPNTKGSSAAWLANRIYESLTATPLDKDNDRSSLSIAFGVASLPADGDSMRSLVEAARQAKQEAKTGTFPVVLSRGAKK